MEEKTKEQNKNENIGQNRPILETHISISKDRKYIIHKTVITDIKPVGYYKKIMEQKE